jgi:hypothetical protein
MSRRVAKLAHAVEDQATADDVSTLHAKLTSQLEALHAQLLEASCWDRDSSSNQPSDPLRGLVLPSWSKQSLRLAQAARDQRKAAGWINSYEACTSPNLR